MLKYLERPGNAEAVRVFAAAVEGLMMRRPRMSAGALVDYLDPITFGNGMYKEIEMPDGRGQGRPWFFTFQFRTARRGRPALVLHYCPGLRIWLNDHEETIGQSEAERLAAQVYCRPYTVRRVSDEAIHAAKEVMERTQS